MGLLEVSRASPTARLPARSVASGGLVLNFPLSVRQTIGTGAFSGGDSIAGHGEDGSKKRAVSGRD